MTQEDKELLLKDLCARLPYGVKCYIPEINDYRVLGSIQYDGINTLFDFWNKEQTRYELQLYISEFKPYLFPMSRMTEEQRNEFDTQTFKIMFGECICKKNYEISYGKLMKFDLDFYNKNHLDWIGLIQIGLAIDSTGLNIY